MFLLSVVALLHDRGMSDGAVLVEDRFGESCCTGGKIDGAVVIFIDFDLWLFTGIIGRLRAEILCEGRAGRAEI